jgi:hypothetical protein
VKHKSVVSVDKLLKKKFIKSDDPDYPFVPLMAVWSQKCPYCEGFAVAKSRIGVMSRLDAHKRREHRARR